MKPTPIRDSFPLLAPLALVLTACSHGGGPPPSDKSTEETLQALGVDTTETPRVDHNGEALPEDYGPLGRTFEVEKLSELVLLGFSPSGSTSPISVFDMKLDETAPGTPPSLVTSLSADDAPWAKEQVPFKTPPASSRAATRADVDGDGREELVFVWFEGSQLFSLVMEDEEAGFARTESFLAKDPEPILDVTLAAGDLDGDGDDELLLVYSVPLLTKLKVVERIDGGLKVVAGSKKLFEAEFSDSLLLAEIETGNLDYDASEEVALVINEYAAPGATAGIECLGSRWFVLDDASSDLAQLDKGVLVARDDQNVVRQALVADLALGDLDSDGIDELVLGGLWQPGGFCHGDYVVKAFDDAAHGLDPMGGKVFGNEAGDEPGDTTSGCEIEVYWAHVGIADLEADAAGEIHVNEQVFYDFESAAPWTPRAQIANWFTMDFVQSTSESTMATGDFTGDARQDIALYAQDRGEVAVWGIEAVDPDQDLVKLRTQPVPKTGGLQSPNPVLLPVNPDSDTTVLQLVEHRFLMTEPIVMAVLAAAPGEEGIGQNTEACTTEYGEATSSSTGSEWDISVSSGFIIGGEFKAWGNGFEIKGKLQKHHGLIWDSTYTVTTSIAYETGPLEDTVVCLVTPYDHYTYKVLADADPAAVGQLIHVSLPREPISLQVERSYYNDSIGSDEMKIDSSVLSHTPGVRQSYMSAADKDAKLAAWGGFETGPASVGQGTGSTTLGIAVSQETGSAIYLGASYELEVEVDVAGIKLGGTVGWSAGHTWSRSVGEETTYAGTVGSIDAEHFVDERYEFGLFVYTQVEPEKDQAFDVVNFWVE